MRILSPDGIELNLTEQLPSDLVESFKIPYTKPQYGSNSHGRYLLQRAKHGEIKACFIDCFSGGTHKISILRRKPAFILVVQTGNTQEFQFQNLSKSLHYEWSINLYSMPNFYCEAHLQKSKDYSTFMLFVPPIVVKRLCGNYPNIKQFYESNVDQEQAARRFEKNAICNFQIVDLVGSWRYGKPKGLRTFVKLIHASFELLNKDHPPQHGHLDVRAVLKIYLVKQYMVQHLTETITRQSLCDQFNITVYGFETGFMNVYNVPPFALLRYYRMEAVKRELTQGIPLGALAIKYGYTYNALVKTYRSVYNVPPVGRRKKS